MCGRVCANLRGLNDVLLCVSYYGDLLRLNKSARFMGEDLQLLLTELCGGSEMGAHSPPPVGAEENHHFIKAYLSVTAHVPELGWTKRGLRPVSPAVKLFSVTRGMRDSPHHHGCFCGSSLFISFAAQITTHD